MSSHIWAAEESAFFPEASVVTLKPDWLTESHDKLIPSTLPQHLHPKLSIPDGQPENL